ncbi:MAG: glycosyltransferase [Alphaproteobacteria bacterium]|nr:glycosyltransferase [Alphaproteobacteria bacterium]
MRSSQTRGLSVVVPCLDEEAVLETTLERLVTVCEATAPGRYEIILVDDGSTDRTWSVIEAATRRNAAIVGVRLSRNHGHQLALLAGLSEVRGELVLVIDADLQDPPEILPDMIDLMAVEGADVVYGKRRTRTGETFFKRLTADWFYRLLDKSTDFEIPLDAGDFRLMTRQISDLLVSMPERDRFTRGMVAWLGFRQVPFLYDREPRHAGETKYTLRKMLRLASDAFLGFSLLPLRFGLFLAAFTSIFSIGMGIFVVGSALMTNTAPGWASAMLFSSIVASAQFAVLGVIGEYVGRIYLQDKKRPLFLVSRLSDRRNAPAREPSRFAASA